MTDRPPPPDPVELVNHLLIHLKPELMQIKDILLYYARQAEKHPNPLNGYGRRMFSQSDEDGITLEILRRIGVAKGVFAEFGVGDGLENNTLALAAAGWKGCWVGGQDLAINPNPLNHPKPNFAFVKAWIKAGNAVALYKEALGAISETAADVISVDIDGSDYYITEELLRAGVAPKLMIVEFNAKFLPPIEWKIEYHDDNRWQGDDYFGASLASFNALFVKHGYFLACCNAFTGANAFFVQSAYADRFKDVPKDLAQLWSEPRYYLPHKYGHANSPRTVELILKQLNS